MLADKNKDGFLTKKEYKAKPKAQPDFMQGNLDEAFKHIAEFKEDDGKVSPIESSIGYDLSFEYETLDKNKNGELSAIELNEIKPWPEVIGVMKEFDKEPKDDILSFFEFDEWHKKKPSGPTEYIKCTVRDEENPDNKNISKCSSMKDCYDFDNSKYENDLCPNPRESCGTLYTWKLDLAVKNWDATDKSLRHYKKFDGFCQNPDTYMKYDATGEGMELDASAQDEPACESVCTKNDECKAWHFKGTECNIITSKIPVEGDGTLGESCNIKLREEGQGCMLTNLCDKNDFNSKKTYRDQYLELECKDGKKWN